MPKCDFNKVLIEITLQHGSSSVNLLHISRTPFLNWMATSELYAK